MEEVKSIKNEVILNKESCDDSFVKDDSFDAEFSLLESTLVDIKEGENQYKFNVNEVLVSIEHSPQDNTPDLSNELKLSFQSKFNNGVVADEKEEALSTNVALSVSPFQSLNLSLPLNKNKINLTSGIYMKDELFPQNTQQTKPTDDFGSPILNHVPKLSLECSSFGVVNSRSECKSSPLPEICLISRGKTDSSTQSLDGIEMENHDIRGICDDSSKTGNEDPFKVTTSCEIPKDLVLENEKFGSLNNATLDNDLCQDQGKPDESSNTGTLKSENDIPVQEIISFSNNNVDNQNHTVNDGKESQNILTNSVGTASVSDNNNPVNIIRLESLDKGNEVDDVDDKCFPNEKEEILVLGSPTQKLPLPVGSQESAVGLNNTELQKLLGGNKDCSKESDTQQIIPSKNNAGVGLTPKPTKLCNIYCSTPVINVFNEDEGKDDKNSVESDLLKNVGSSTSSSNHLDLGTDLGSCIKPISNKNSSSGIKKMNLKRKNLNLDCIEEGNEDISDDECSGPVKKVKLDEVKIDFEKENVELSSSLSRFEAPAKSILKKWQPSGMSRNSSSYFVLDECGESDHEENAKTSQGTTESNTADDFENECKSFEELLKGSYNIDALEKYHSQVMMESQMDDEKFDELLQELTFQINDRTSYSLKPMEESVTSEKTSCELKLMEESQSNDVSKETVAHVSSIGKAEADVDLPPVKSSHEQDNDKLASPGSSKKLETCKGEIDCEASGSKETANVNMIAMDEEDYLLEGELNAEKKPYEFFEFVSTDPKENEDNYNPEWQKLGRLTNDQERYKAVRDRWRSLVPPDPNKDLTCRQWRKKNNMPPTSIHTLNNNLLLDDDHGERNMPCTAVFERKISRLVEDLESSRMNIINQRNIDFQNLANDQDAEQRNLLRRGGNEYELEMLHRKHIQQCIGLKEQHDLNLSRIKAITNEKINILKSASDEVFLFQQFYKGVGAVGDNVSLFMTDTQVQELIETEEMLEDYVKFYK